MADPEWQKVGVVSVDGGRIFVGDPSYTMRDEELDNLINTLTASRYPSALQVNHDMGHPGKGISVSAGYGDGFYPVFIRKSDDGRVAEVRVVFIDDAELSD